MMDLFSLCMDVLCLLGQSVLHLRFVCRLTGKRGRLWHFAAYFALLCGIELLFHQLPPGGGMLPVGACALALYAVSRILLDNARAVSCLGALLAVYISQLSFGIIDAAELVLFPGFIGTGWLYLLLIGALAVFFFLCACCYGAVVRLLPPAEEAYTPYIGLLLLPCLFFFAAQLYILRTAYQVAAAPLSGDEPARQGVLLLLQSIGLGALFCILCAFRHLCRGCQAQSQVRSLTQAAQAQKIYLREARERERRTRSFRHDIKNHLAVLDGLLAGGRVKESRDYLEKLEAASAGLSFPCQTGSPVVDILLGEKLGLAKGVRAEVDLRLPESWSVDELDLCVIFANALDNALAACQGVADGEAPFLRIAGKRQGSFYLLTFENSCQPGPLPPAGTGLSNIRGMAERYRGAVLTEKSEGRFALHVLLNLS